MVVLRGEAVHSSVFGLCSQDTPVVPFLLKGEKMGSQKKRFKYSHSVGSPAKHSPSCFQPIESIANYYHEVQ